MRSGSVAEARLIYQEVLERFPKNKRAQQGLAVLNGSNRPATTQCPPPETIKQIVDLYNQGQCELVVERIQPLTEQYPEAFIVWNILGVAAKGLGKTVEALKAFQRVIELQPDYVDGYNNLGVTLKDIGDLEDAILAFKKALVLKPNYAEALNNLGIVFADQGKLEDALGCYNKALSIQPANAIFCNNIGIVLGLQGEFEISIKMFKKALALAPVYAEAFNNMGNIKKELGQLDEAIEAYGNALVIKPDYAEAYNNMGDAYLRKRNFKKGFELYEWRWKTPQQIGDRLLSSKPEWGGQNGARVLVYSEQGIGDEIMFASVITDLHKICSGLILSCNKRLIPLFKRSFNEYISYEVSKKVVDESKYDYHIPIGSLPKMLRPNLESFKNSSFGYLIGDKKKAIVLKERLLRTDKKRLVGICWYSKSILSNAQERNISLEQLACHLNNEETQLVSLQYGDVSEKISELKHNHGIDVIQVKEIDNGKNMDGLACLILACDQIISVDNATVHLAGALGVETKLLLPFRHDWRWGDGQTGCYWYDTVEFYKQRQLNNWGQVLKRLKI